MGALRARATLNRCLQTGTQAQEPWPMQRIWLLSPLPAPRATLTPPLSKPAILSSPHSHKFIVIRTSYNKTTSPTHFNYVKSTQIPVFLVPLSYLNHNSTKKVHNNTLVGVHKNRVCKADNLEIMYNFCFYVKNFNLYSHNTRIYHIIFM